MVPQTFFCLRLKKAAHLLGSDIVEIGIDATCEYSRSTANASTHCHLQTAQIHRFVIGRFLMCKHLVQSVCAVTPQFFFEVGCNRTTPFYSHPSVIELPLDDDTSDDNGSDDGRRSPPLFFGPTIPAAFLPLAQFEDPDPDQRLTTTEASTRLQSTFVNKMMPSQFQYPNPRWLSTLE